MLAHASARSVFLFLLVGGGELSASPFTPLQGIEGGGMGVLAMRECALSTRSPEERDGGSTVLDQKGKGIMQVGVIAKCLLRRCVPGMQTHKRTYAHTHTHQTYTRTHNTLVRQKYTHTYNHIHTYLNLTVDALFDTTPRDTYINEQKNALTLTQTHSQTHTLAHT